MSTSPILKPTLLSARATEGERSVEPSAAPAVSAPSERRSRRVESAEGEAAERLRTAGEEALVDRRRLSVEGEHDPREPVELEHPLVVARPLEERALDVRLEREARVVRVASEAGELVAERRRLAGV